MISQTKSGGSDPRKHVDSRAGRLDFKPIYKVTGELMGERLLVGIPAVDWRKVIIEGPDQIAELGPMVVKGDIQGERREALSKLR